MIDSLFVMLLAMFFDWILFRESVFVFTVMINLLSILPLFGLILA